jgi:integrase
MSELIGAHIRFLEAGKKSPRTIESRQMVLRQVHAYLPFGLAYAATEELNDFLASDPTWSAWTMCTYAMHIRGFYRWAAGPGRLLELDPTIEMANPKSPDVVPRPVTEEELAHALEHSPEPWLTIITLAAFAGLRCSEAAGVRREHVTEETIHIAKAKGGSAASVDTHPVIWELVRDRPPGPLAFTPRGRPVYGRWLMTRERIFFDSIGMPDVTLHRFRHRYGTALREAGNDLFVVQAAMRHRSIQSTVGYTLVSGGQRRLAIRSLPSPVRPPAGDQTN